MGTAPAGTVGTGGATQAGAADHLRSPYALLLLAWIEAIKATGGTLATVSLVDAARDMALSAGLRSAAASAVSLSIAATAVAAGVAADRLGRRPLLMASFVLAGAANLAIVFFPAGWVYVACLVLAGLGYSVMLTSSYAYTKAVAPGRSLGLGLGLVGMFTTIVVMATTIGGGALAGIGWRWLFLVVPVMCAVSLVLTPRLLPPMPRTGSGRVDVVGLVLLGAAMVAVISGVSRVTAHPPDRTGWFFILVGVCLLRRLGARGVAPRGAVLPGEDLPLAGLLRGRRRRPCLPHRHVGHGPDHQWRGAVREAGLGARHDARPGAALHRRRDRRPDRRPGPGETRGGAHRDDARSAGRLARVPDVRPARGASAVLGVHPQRRRGGRRHRRDPHGTGTGHHPRRHRRRLRGRDVVQDEHRPAGVGARDGAHHAHRQGGHRDSTCGGTSRRSA